MFELTNEEANSFVCPVGYPNLGMPPIWALSAYTPFALYGTGGSHAQAFCIQQLLLKVNINIMRAFVSIRQYVLASDTKNQEIDELRQRIQELESQGSKSIRND